MPADGGRLRFRTKKILHFSPGARILGGGGRKLGVPPLGQTGSSPPSFEFL
jgi:hypothetical protein